MISEIKCNLLFILFHLMCSDVWPATKETLWNAHMKILKNGSDF